MEASLTVKRIALTHDAVLNSCHGANSYVFALLFARAISREVVGVLAAEFDHSSQDVVGYVCRRTGNFTPADVAHRVWPDAHDRVAHGLAPLVYASPASAEDTRAYDACMAIANDLRNHELVRMAAAKCAYAVRQALATPGASGAGRGLLRPGGPVNELA